MYCLLMLLITQLQMLNLLQFLGATEDNTLTCWEGNSTTQDAFHINVSVLEEWTVNKPGIFEQVHKDNTIVTLKSFSKYRISFLQTILGITQINRK